jgi:hypothetical protein
MTAPDLFQASTDEAVSVDQFNTLMQTCNTFDDLRAFVGTTGQEMCARGKDAVNDGYGGLFYWDGSSTGTDDDLTIITPTGQTSGRWLRQGPYTPGIAGTLTGSATVDFPSTDTSLMGVGDVTITVTGAAVGDWVQLSGSSVLAAGGMLWGVVSSANTVTPYYVNLTGGTVNPGSMTVYALVMKRS